MWWYSFSNDVVCEYFIITYINDYAENKWEIEYGK